MADSTNRDVNAYTDPRKIVSGCQHRMGCKCEIPFWLRDATPRELAFESRIVTPNRPGFPQAGPPIVPGCGKIAPAARSIHKDFLLMPK